MESLELIVQLFFRYRPENGWFAYHFTNRFRTDGQRLCDNG